MLVTQVNKEGDVAYVSGTGSDGSRFTVALGLGTGAVRVEEGHPCLAEAGNLIGCAALRFLLTRQQSPVLR